MPPGVHGKRCTRRHEASFRASPTRVMAPEPVAATVSERTMPSYLTGWTRAQAGSSAGAVIALHDFTSFLVGPERTFAVHHLFNHASAQESKHGLWIIWSERRHGRSGLVPAPPSLLRSAEQRGETAVQIDGFVRCYQAPRTVRYPCRSRAGGAGEAVKLCIAMLVANILFCR
jgi:hypothetical protein